MITPCEETRRSFTDLDVAAIEFYKMVAVAYEDDPSVEVALHDLVAGETLASFYYNPDDAIGRVIYNVKTPLLGN